MPTRPTLTEVTIDDRIAGALLGVHVGDALGASAEFMSPAQVQEHFPLGVYEVTGGGAFDWEPGAATDDTSLTKAVLDAYLEAPDDVVRAAADNMLAWMRTGPPDVGGATHIGLTRYAESGDPAKAGAGHDQAGNGSLMRTIPVGLARADKRRRHQEAVAISAITHDDARCTGACVAYSDLVHHLVEGVDPEAAVELVLEEEWLDEFSPHIRRALIFGKDLAPDSLHLASPEIIPAMEHGPYGGGGYVLDALTIAVGAVLTPDPFEDVLPLVVQLGGDADTNGAISGGLLGARDGVGAIPDEWLEPLEHRDHFTSAASALAALRSG